MVNSSFDQIIFISDIHFGKGTLETLQNMKDYFDNFFIPLVKKQKISHNPCIVITGDYFDNRQTLDINVMNVAINIMNKISSLCNVYVIVGNHDIYKKSDTDVTSLKVFENNENVTIIYDKYELILKNNKKILLVSWVGDFKKENKIITDNKDKYDLLVFHTELSGMTYANNRPIINGLNIDIIDDDKIVSGHIHKRQESKKGIYLGSPYHIDRSDIGNRKGIYTYTVENENIVKQFYENTYSPEYILKRFSDVGRNPKDWENIVRNNYVYIVFTTEELDIVNTEKFINELRQYKPKNIELIEDRPKININESQTSIDDSGNVIDLNVKPDSTIEDVFTVKLQAFKLNKSAQKNINKLNTEYLKRATEELKQ